MSTSKLSTPDVTWATRARGGGSTECDYLDFLIDGQALSALLKTNCISPFGWGSADEQAAAADRLLRRAPPDLPEGRVSLYVCPECRGLDCGAVSILVERGPGVVIWKDFAFQSEDKIQRDGFERLGPFVFSGHEYHD